ncbi:thioredoxin-like protein, partial [Lipomyces japonicus]|uniref:thioredoxin-like protein n=1 Tax=Lipomyces japonicus TaxID=56871 RepID=UPI0034CDF318
MISRKWSRTIIFLVIFLVGSITFLRSTGQVDYEVPDFKKLKKEHSESFDPTHHGYEPLDEIRDLLVNSPVVIFSKSYCPHSKFVKSLLSEQYKISPAPYVRELDLDPHGHELQDALADITGRKTVPNVFVGGKSLGGGDEMRLLHGQNQLEGEFLKNGGRRLKISKSRVKL